MVDVHDHNARYAHGTSLFLPWHRMYILGYENLLRSLPGFECVTVPYWDWEREKDREMSAAPLKRDTFGSLANQPSSTQCINSGIARTWEARQTIGGTPCVKRAVRRSGSFTGEASMQEMIQNEPLDAEFSRWLEGSPHASPHNFIGGHMSSMLSPQDPLFFMHHANVDRMWGLWQDFHEYDQVSKFALTSTHYTARGSGLVGTGEVGLDAVMPFRYSNDPASVMSVFREPVRTRDVWALTDQPGGISVTYGPDNLAGLLQVARPNVAWRWFVPESTPYLECSEFVERTAEVQSYSNSAVQELYVQLLADESMAQEDIVRALALLECATYNPIPEEWIANFLTVDVKYFRRCDMLLLLASDS